MCQTTQRDSIVPHQEPLSAIKTTESPVSVYTEWDPLEEVIVGVVNGSCVPEWDRMIEATSPEKHADFFQRQGGKPFSPELIQVANTELEEFVNILEGEGVKVRRPEEIDFSVSYSTPNWKMKSGLYAAMPRDCLLIFGNEIIECPMAWRSRYHELDAFKPLLKEYFHQGAHWTSAPRPQLKEELYDKGYDKKGGYVATEFEPVFDAADFIRCGKDIFCQRSHVTNEFGIEWLRRHLDGKYKIHVLEVNDPAPMHIDATLLPLAPGKLLVNSERLGKVPDIFRSWDILEAPEPCVFDDYPLYMTSEWISMNVLMLDEKRVLVEKGEEALIKSLRSWGFVPILCSFKNFNSFGGAFHCATLDIRRKGGLQSYF